MNGVTENELCPVYAAYAGPSPFAAEPDPAEVAEIRWVDWEDFCEAARSGRHARLAVVRHATGRARRPRPEAAGLAAGRPGGLPPAARG